LPHTDHDDVVEDDPDISPGQNSDANSADEEALLDHSTTDDDEIVPTTPSVKPHPETDDEHSEEDEADHVDHCVVKTQVPYTHVYPPLTATKAFSKSEIAKT